jgi:hypothetical protein
MIYGDGPKWQEQRRYSLHVLFGIGGRNLMEERILDETHKQIEKMVKQIEIAGGERAEIEVADVFNLVIGSVLNQMIAGYGFDEVSSVTFH